MVKRSAPKAKKPRPVSEKKTNRKSHMSGGKNSKTSGSGDSGDGKKHRRPPPSSKYRWGADGKPKVDVAKEKKKKGKTVSLVAAKRSKYLEKLDSYSGKKTIKGVSGMKKDETKEAYLARTRETTQKNLKEVNTSSMKLKNKEKWKQYNEKKEKKDKQRKAARKARDEDSDSELDEERTILDGPRKHRKVEFDRPAFGEVVHEPPRDLKDIAAKMLSKQSLTRYAEKVAGEKWDKTIKKVVIPDVELEQGEDDEDRLTEEYQAQLEKQRREAEDAGLSPEAAERKKRKEESRLRKLERLAVLKEEIATREKAEAAAREKRTLYTKFSIADLMSETKKRAEKAIKRKARKAGEDEDDEE